MGEFVCGTVQVGDARIYDDYSAKAAKVMRQLMGEGKLPEGEAVQDFITVTRRWVSTVRQQAETAASQGKASLVPRFEVSAQEYRMLQEMGDSLSALMEIMQMRGRVDLTPPPEAMTFSAAIAGGTYTP